MLNCCFCRRTTGIPANENKSKNKTDKTTDTQSNFPRKNTSVMEVDGHSVDSIVTNDILCKQEGVASVLSIQPKGSESPCRIADNPNDEKGSLFNIDGGSTNAQGGKNFWKIFSGFSLDDGKAEKVEAIEKELCCDEVKVDIDSDFVSVLPQVQPTRLQPTPDSSVSDQQSKSSTSISLNSTNRKREDTVFAKLTSKLAIALPDATDAERKRFLLARKGDYKGALDQLKGYIAWRQEYHLDEDDNNIQAVHSISKEFDDYLSCASSVGAQDRVDWDNAANAALNHVGNTIKGATRTKVDGTTLPQLAHMVTGTGSLSCMTDKEGHRILQLLPAQIDLKIADEEVYALAIAFYLDRKLDRSNMEKIVVSIDVRAGQGWANPPAKKVVPFIKRIVSILERNFPERLSKCIVFPLPTAATILWKMVKVFLDPTTRSKIVIIAGSSGIHDKVSHSKFNNLLLKSVHERMEEIRQESFVTTP